MLELEKTISKLESTYVVERGKVSTTIYFHKSSYDCVNYRVTYNFEACLTYIAQYHSNAHSNHHQGSKTYFHIFNIDSFQKAEDCFINGNLSFLSQDDLIEPKNKRGSKVRKKALLELKDFDRDYRGSAFRDEIEEALSLCERLLVEDKKNSIATSPTLKRRK